MVRAHTFIYLAPAHEGDEIAVATWIKENDGKCRLIREFELRRISDGQLLVRGETLFVCITLPLTTNTDAVRLCDKICAGGSKAIGPANIATKNGE